MAAVLPWILFSVLSLAEGTNCRNLKIREMNGKILANHSIRTIKPIKDVDECISMCYLESLCFGCNYCDVQDNTPVCELTNSDHIRSEKDLKDQPGCTYYGSENACSSDPCKNNATCQGDFDLDPIPYKCICPAGYTGQTCEDDVNECLGDENDCHDKAVCNNIKDGFICTCKVGFHGNGKHCEACNTSTPLGMESGAIPHSSITASSMWDQNHSPDRARLNIKRVGNRRGAWSAKTNNMEQWLQVDLGTVTNIRGIATQGRQDTYQWVKTYSLQYSLDGQHFDEYKNDKIFAGNSNRNSIVKHELNPAIIAKYIRIRPKTWEQHISLRMELFGCN